MSFVYTEDQNFNAGRTSENAQRLSQIVDSLPPDNNPILMETYINGTSMTHIASKYFFAYNKMS